MFSDDLFATWFEEMEDSLHRIAYSILRNHADVQDAIQEGLVKAWNARDKCRVDTFKPWLTKIVVNECRNIQRKRMRETPVDQLPEEPYHGPAEDLGLREALDSLPEGHRTALLLQSMQGFSGKEIATALGISHAAVRFRLFQARNMLKKAMGQEGVSAQ